MKKYFKIIATTGLCLMLAGAFTSCEDWLEEKPHDFIGPTMLEGSDASAKMWVVGAYNKFQTELFIWANWPRGVELDNDYITGPSWALKHIGSGNFLSEPSQQADPIWKGPYRIINAANNAIEQIEDMSGLSDSYYKNALGELYTMKAWAYFILVRAFGEVPIYYTSINSGTDAHQPRRPVQEVYEHIIDLLDQAKDMCYKNTDSQWEKYHISAGTAAGLLAKVYATIASSALPSGKLTVKTGQAFKMEEVDGQQVMVLLNPTPFTFDKTTVDGVESFDPAEYFGLARNMAKDVMDGDYGTFELVSYDELWVKDRDTREHMWSHQTRSDDGTFGIIYGPSYCGQTDASGYVVYGMHFANRDHWYKIFEEKDYRIEKGVQHIWKMYNQATNYNAGSYYPDNAKYRMMATGRDMSGVKVADPVAPYNDGFDYTYSVSDQYLAYTTKYMDVTDRTKSRTDAQWSFLRYADVVLIFAEADNEVNYPSTEALEALNSVRRRSNATEAASTDFASKDAFRSAVFEERAKEFACEADRRWDLIRWGIYLDAMNAIGGYDECGNLKTRTRKHLLFPIPQDELRTNDNIDENNFGW